MSRQPRSAQTRRALIRSAAQTFDEHGYPRAKLTAISAGAGVSTGALHFHFDTKAAVAAAVEDEAARTLHDSARTVRHLTPDPLQALVDTTHVLARQLATDVVARAGYRLNCQSAYRSGPDLRTRWHVCVRELLDRAGEQELLVPGLAAEESATALVGATTGFEVLAREDANWLTPSAVTGLWRSFLPMLAGPGAPQTPEPSGTRTTPRVRRRTAAAQRTASELVR
ncbi:ScbR family autoregulator-binding transcription factor [Streptomyces benahoarensis]|uniref:TetR/AcrR family transcriptional regulator n=1 Tax=Streptomyces benahoarensis TaxID=2595054 RepID=A0A553ZL83_9ACTN|nr:ScbR family autoregulator-binding transcription factor [Streptomyces benahoarensis]TSB22500.1 TetR/AcrR family transcriptional regulator [Streptomyces benahoarensis]TSB42248.1 TetR/AcrR family transcriptional regulator [Streptomyces benahoarensis]